MSDEISITLKYSRPDFEKVTEVFGGDLEKALLGWADEMKSRYSSLPYIIKETLYQKEARKTRGGQ